MKFGDKLYKLRRAKGYSQEELGEKLGVTRQTISKWELDQSKPDTDKLQEISKLFNIGVNELTDDNLKIDDVPDSDGTEKRPRRWLLVILIILALAIVVVLLNKIVMDKKNNKDSNDNNGIFNIFDQEKSKVSQNSFNNKFEFYAGTIYGSRVSYLFDEVIENNKKNKDQLVKVIYEETSTTDSTEIKNLKKKFDSWTKYEVSFEYNDDGYIYEILIEDYETETKDDNTTSNETSSQTGTVTIPNNTKKDDFDKESFNSQATFHAGNEDGFFVKSMIDYVIKNNISNTAHQLYVEYNGVQVSDQISLGNLKSNFADFTKYNVIVNYGSDGYASGFTVLN